jgi:hypothetical protein
VLLADHFSQCLRAPFAVENLSHVWGLLYLNAQDFSHRGYSIQDGKILVV